MRRVRSSVRHGVAEPVRSRPPSPTRATRRARRWPPRAPPTRAPHAGRGGARPRRSSVHSPVPRHRAAGPPGRRGRIRSGPSATRATTLGCPAWPSAGLAVQAIPARRTSAAGATIPTKSTAASKAPTAWTHPDPLEWATPVQAKTTRTAPTTGVTQATGWIRRRSTCPEFVASPAREPGGLMWPGRVPPRRCGRPGPDRRWARRRRSAGGTGRRRRRLGRPAA